MIGKYFLTLILGLTSILGFSQDYTVQGTVVNTGSLSPINLIAVNINGTGTTTYSATVYTNASGFFTHTIPGGGATGPNLTWALTVDSCQGGLIVRNFENAQGVTNSYDADTLHSLCSGGTASISDNFLNDNYKIFPNPFSNTINVLAYDLNRNTKIRIFNSVGVTVFEEQSLSELASNFDMSTMNAGIYFVELKLNGKRITKKLIKNE